MHIIGKYLFSVIAVSLLISICKTLFPDKGIVGSVLKLICGVLLAFAIITPFQNLNIDNMQSLYSVISNDAAGITCQGEKIAKEELLKSIDENLTAYILDKAGAMDLDLEIQFQFNEEAIPQPKGITIKGNASPYARTQLIRTISTDLGIGEENIKWY